MDGCGVRAGVKIKRKIKAAGNKEKRGAQFLSLPPLPSSLFLFC